MSEKNTFSISKRAQSFVHAGRGLRVFIAGTHNAWIHLVLMAIGICMGAYFRITQMEWIAIIFASGFVLVAEAFNTAIEIDINLTSPDFHPYAKDTKDVAAAAVLLSAMTSLAVGLIVFIPYLIAL